MIKNNTTPFFKNLSQPKGVTRKNILFHLQPSTTAIIPFGMSQSSGIGFGTVLPQKVYSMYVLTTFLHSVILGLLLGDGWFEKNVGKRSINARFGLKQGLINIEFLLFVFNLLSPLCGSMPVLSNSTRKTGEKYSGLTFKTRAFPFFTLYYDKF